MRVLVSAASKHGATAEIGDRVEARLRERGLEVTVATPEAARPGDGYDGIALDSGFYAGHWLKDAKELADRIAGGDPIPPTWLFSSGPFGDPPKPDEDRVGVAKIVETLPPVEHRLFSGKTDKSQLGFGEKAIMIAVRAPERDYWDWDEIAARADEIADVLGEAAE